MATTTGGTTYVTSTDLVADYPTASLALANRVDVVASGSMSKKTASYTVTVADILAGTTICMNSASATVITLPSTSLVNGMRLNVFSVNTGAVTFTGGTVTGTVNSITSQYSGVSVTYDSAAAAWWCLPFSSGVSAANFSNTATGTYSGYKYVSFTGNGTLTISRAGLADVLCVGGGGGTAGGYGAGGGGGFKRVDNLYLPSGNITVTVGAGGGTPAAGTASSLGTILSSGGGGRGLGSGGAEMHAYTSGAGSAGGVGGYTSDGNSANGAGGFGAISDSITGTAVNYAPGGDTGTKGSAPGAGGQPRNSAVSGNAGIVIIRVAV